MDYTTKSIQTKEGLAYLRHRPGALGFDPHSPQGQYQLVKEVIDNTVDEATQFPNKRATTNITFIKFGKSYQVIVEDRGRGVPLAKLLDAFTKPGTSGKWNDAYLASIGTNGIGAKGTAALSRKFCVITRRPEGSGILSLHQGEVIHHEIVKQKIKDAELYGTTVLYDPDPSICRSVDQFFEDKGAYNMLIDLFEFITAITPNLTINVWFSKARIKDDSIIGKPLEVLAAIHSQKRDLIHSYEGGTITPIDYLRNRFGLKSPSVWESPLFKREYTSFKDADKFGYEIQFFLTEDHARRAGYVVSAVNRTRIEAKTAVQIVGYQWALKRQLTRFIEDKATKAYFDSVYNLPFHTVIMAMYQGAAFKDQDKNNFTDQDFFAIYRTHLDKEFKAMGDEFWQAVYDLIAEDIFDKYQRYANKDLRLNEGTKNLAFGLRNPKTYTPCSLHDSSVTELFITEGDSAGGGVSQICNKATQAVYRLRGKPLNPYKCKEARFRANDVMHDMIKIIGVAPTDQTLDNMNFCRIGILTDADADGYHIAALLVGILYRINPLIITEGRVFIANPPLYVLQTKSRSDPMFVRNKDGLASFRSFIYEKLLDVHLVYGKAARHPKGSDFHCMVESVLKVGDVYASVARRLGVDAELLEMMVGCLQFIDRKKINTRGIIDLLGLDNCQHQELSNSIVLSFQDEDYIIPLDNLINEIKAFVLPELKASLLGETTFKVTTKQTETYSNTPMTVVKLYKIFKCADAEFRISRLKGLGEMDPEQLCETCVDPVTRSFTNITSVGSLDRIYKLLGVDSDNRKTLVVSRMRGIEMDLVAQV